MEFSISNLGSTGSSDFEKTEIVSSGSARADGVSELTVMIQLKNSDNAPVAEYRPEYDVVSGQGVIKGECTKSLNNGLSYCILKATASGQKRLRLINAKVGLESTVQFDSPASPLVEKAPGSSAILVSTTASGTIGTFMLGAQSGKTMVSSGGYKLDASMQETAQ